MARRGCRDRRRGPRGQRCAWPAGAVSIETGAKGVSGPGGAVAIGVRFPVAIHVRGLAELSQ